MYKLEKLASLNPLSFYLYSQMNASKVRYDAWYVVLAVVILALAATIYLGLAAWCVIYGHGRFTGEFRWVWFGFKVNAHCTH